MGTIEIKTKEDIFNQSNKTMIDKINLYIQQYFFWHHMGLFKTHFAKVDLPNEQKNFFKKEGEDETNQVIIEIKKQSYLETQIKNNENNTDIFPNILYLIEQQIQSGLSETSLSNDNVLYMLQILASFGKQQYNKKIDPTKLDQSKIGVLRKLFNGFNDAKKFVKDNEDIFPNILYLIGEQRKRGLDKKQLKNDNVLYMLQVLAASGEYQYGKKIKTEKLDQSKIGTLRDYFTDINEAKRILTKDNYLNYILDNKKTAPINIDKLGGTPIRSFDINTINAPSLIASSFSNATNPTHSNSLENQLRIDVYKHGLNNKQQKKQEFKLYVAKSVTQKNSANQFGLWTIQKKGDIYFECKIISNFGLEIPVLIKYDIKSKKFDVKPKTFICMTNRYELNQYHFPISKISIYEFPESKFDYEYEKIDRKNNKLNSILKTNQSNDILIVKLKQDTGFSKDEIEYTIGETFDAIGLSQFNEDGSKGRNKKIFYQQNMNGYENLTNQYNLLHPKDKKTVQEMIMWIYDIIQTIPKTDCYNRNLKLIKDKLTKWKESVGIQSTTTYGLEKEEEQEGEDGTKKKIKKKTNDFGIYLRPRLISNGFDNKTQYQFFKKEDYLIAKKYINWMVDKMKQ